MDAESIGIAVALGWILLICVGWAMCGGGEP